MSFFRMHDSQDIIRINYEEDLLNCIKSHDAMGVIGRFAVALEIGNLYRRLRHMSPIPLELQHLLSTFRLIGLFRRQQPVCSMFIYQ